MSEIIGATYQKQRFRTIGGGSGSVNQQVGYFNDFSPVFPSGNNCM
jgi:hypothetical protein